VGCVAESRRPGWQLEIHFAIQAGLRQTAVLCDSHGRQSCHYSRCEKHPLHNMPLSWRYFAVPSTPTLKRELDCCSELGSQFAPKKTELKNESFAGSSGPNLLFIAPSSLVRKARQPFSQSLSSLFVQ
jgi:hypothetical protein